MLALWIQDAAWQAAHAPEAWWHRALADFGPWLLAATLLALIVRAFAQAKRYRAVGVLAQADLDQVHDALRAAEQKTIGEIVPVVVERSDGHPETQWLSALVFVLAGSAVLEPHLPWNEPALVLAAQLGLGALGFAIARALPGFARLFMRESRATEVAEEQATQEFHRLDLQATQAASGVLIFVSLFERRVVVLADHGVDAEAGAEHWHGVNEAVLRGVARGSLRDGLVDGIARAGAVLAEHFPVKPGDRNELPDRVVLRRE
jgi:putative membrane protein